MNSVNEVNMVPVKDLPRGQLLLRNVAQVRRSTMPGEYDRYNMRRVVSMTANVEGEDLGRVAKRIDKALQAAGEPPRGVTVAVPGKCSHATNVSRPEHRPGRGGRRDCVAADRLLPIAAISVHRRDNSPGGPRGSGSSRIRLTHTTLNIQSVHVRVMAIGVAVANADSDGDDSC